MSKSEQYARKLLDERWQNRRREILERDDYTCQRCYAFGKKPGEEFDDPEDEPTAILQVHHRIYLPRLEPWEYADEYLVTLCDPCHDAEHAAREQFEPRILQAIRLRIWGDDLPNVEQFFLSGEMKKVFRDSFSIVNSARKVRAMRGE